MFSRTELAISLHSSSKLDKP